MQFQLPSNHTTILTGTDVFIEARAEEAIRGHFACKKDPYVLMYGMSPLSDHQNVNGMIFVSEDEELTLSRYSLVVVYLPSQTVYQNGNVLIEVCSEHHAAFTKLSGTVPFLVIVQ